jgi:hypothetical protein
MRKRLKLAWGALWGKYDGTQASPWPPKITHLINWRDDLLAVDSEGRIWRMKSDYGDPKMLIIELLSENPVPKW